MQLLNKFLDYLRNFVRRGMRQIARLVNKLTGGHLNPNAVTLFGFAMHLPIAVVISQGYFIYAGLLLIFFGLFDALDGQLARLQNRTSKLGMLLDSVTDRMKEAILYIGIGYFFVWANHPYFAVWSIAACGSSLLVSYINAWGDVVTKDLKDTGLTNKAFRGGLMSFDIRMFSIVIGLLTNHLGAAIIIIAILSWVTALDRLIRISRYLNHAKS